MNALIGQKIDIHCYKHDGKINTISSESLVLDETADFLVCANDKIKIIENDGRIHKTKEPAIIFFYKKNWFNVIAQFKKYGLFYYCNMASPYIIDENVLKYIDYDLDLRVFPDGSHHILDRNEYEFHKKIMNYSESLDYVINKELEKLINMKENNLGPFNLKIAYKYKVKSR